MRASYYDTIGGKELASVEWYFTINGKMEARTRRTVIKDENEVIEQNRGGLAWVNMPEGNTGHASSSITAYTTGGKSTFSSTFSSSTTHDHTETF